MCPPPRIRGQIVGKEIEHVPPMPPNESLTGLDSQIQCHTARGVGIWERAHGHVPFSRRPDMVRCFYYGGHDAVLSFGEGEGVAVVVPFDGEICPEDGNFPGVGDIAVGYSSFINLERLRGKSAYLDREEGRVTGTRSGNVEFGRFLLLNLLSNDAAAADVDAAKGEAAEGGTVKAVAMKNV